MSEPRCYRVGQLLTLLSMSRSTFFELRRRGKLPFLEELTPRLGSRARYRADLVDRYLAGQWNGPRAFQAGARARASGGLRRVG
jgi:predicted DNA-binding transcriptional regulator AlpA